ncbi:heterokaryon incompatibility protein-domain-containing protein [Trametes punicea]|nr:heterokaryon incompatibility protein-domain-containing protein [Trametes punicea]
MSQGFPSPLQPFTVADALKVLQACEGSIDANPLHDSPLRVLVRDDKGPYRVVPYQGQPYIAISYCWPGENFRKRGISNKPTPVLLSTGGALVQSHHFSSFISRAVQSYNASLAVWIDYHCINQDDFSEKTAQIAIMQRIYMKAQITLVMLEDIALSPEQQEVLTKYRANAESVDVARHVFSARWFSRAWCSQELVLSHHATICVHDASRDGETTLFAAETFWYCVTSARNRDPSIPLFSVPRGHTPDIAIAKSTFAWALGLVHRLGCSDQYDKAALVCNLVRFIYRFASRPTAFREEAPAIRLNVLKMMNVLAFKRRDFSLLLANHGRDNPLRGVQGFGWAGEPVDGDRFSELWNQKDYRVEKDLQIKIDHTGLVARGCLARVQAEHTWAIHGNTRTINTVEFYTHPSWAWTLDSQHLQQLMVALTCFYDGGRSNASLHARIVFAYLLGEDYELPPEPIQGDLEEVARSYFDDSFSLKDIAAAMAFIWREPDRATFSTIRTEDGTVLLGSLCSSPTYVVRPRLFSPPMVLTANSMILTDEQLATGAYRCIGCVRGLGMVRDIPGRTTASVCVV